MKLKRFMKIVVGLLLGVGLFVTPSCCNCESPIVEEESEEIDGKVREMSIEQLRNFLEGTVWKGKRYKRSAIQEISIYFYSCDKGSFMYFNEDISRLNEINFYFQYEVYKNAIFFKSEQTSYPAWELNLIWTIVKIADDELVLARNIALPIEKQDRLVLSRVKI